MVKETYPRRSNLVLDDDNIFIAIKLIIDIYKSQSPMAMDYILTFELQS